MGKMSYGRYTTSYSHPHADDSDPDFKGELVQNDQYAETFVDDFTLEAFTAADEELARRSGVDYLRPSSRDEAMFRYVTALRNRDALVSRIKSTEKEYRALGRKLEEDRSLKATLDRLLDPDPRLF